jgi:DNA-binding NarL/FixJ family response regulator
VKKIRVVVGDGHELIRRGLRALLRPCRDLTLLADGTDGHEILAKTRQLNPNVVVLELSLPRKDGFEVIEGICRLDLGTEIVVLTTHESDQMVRQALQAGAKGYVLKSDPGRDIISAIRAVARHRQYLTSKVSEIIVESFVRNQEARMRAAPADARLTFRQREIVRLLATGLGNTRIAAELGISVKTVETHWAAIARSLNIRTKEELVRYARWNKIVAGQSTSSSRT